MCPTIFTAKLGRTKAPHSDFFQLFVGIKNGKAIFAHLLFSVASLTNLAKHEAKSTSQVLSVHISTLIFNLFSRWTIRVHGNRLFGVRLSISL